MNNIELLYLPIEIFLYSIFLYTIFFNLWKQNVLLLRLSLSLSLSLSLCSDVCGIQREAKNEMLVVARSFACVDFKS